MTPEKNMSQTCSSTSIWESFYLSLQVYQRVLQPANQMESNFKAVKYH